MPIKNTHRIVLTGGPGGGKSTAADLIRRELGDLVVIVPESATLLFSGGFPRVDDFAARRAAQKAIFHIQTNMEEVQHSLYPGRVLLCDRGTVDGAVYWPDGNGEFFSSMATTQEKEFARYDGVIFFESAAVGGIQIEGGNPVRTETIRQAIDIDNGLKKIWEKHSNFVHIPHHPSFFHKLQCALEAIQNMMQLLAT